MESREIVLRTLEFTGPARIAASMPPPYWNDLTHVSYHLQGYAAEWQDVGGGRQEYVDEWGNTWARIDAYSKGEVARGAIEDINAVTTHPLPDLANPANFAHLRDLPDEGKFRVGGLPGFPFNVARKMRRLDQFLMDLILERDKIQVLLKRVEDLLAEVILQYAAVGVDGVMFPEDWGTQLGLMIHPRMWRELFKPGFARLCAVAHEQSVKVLMHSCGKITAIIPDLIEVGIDALQFDQPRLHGLDALAAFRGKIAFWCPVDIQTTLQTQEAGLIEAEARALIEMLGGPEGGFIAGYYAGNEAIGLDPRWQDIACQAFSRYGVFVHEGEA